MNFPTVLALKSSILIVITKIDDFCSNKDNRLILRCTINETYAFNLFQEKVNILPTLTLQQ